MTSKKIPEFNELVDEAARQIHTALLESGGKEMKASIHMWMVAAINWEKETSKRERNKR